MAFTFTFKERSVDRKLVGSREVEAHVRVPMSTLPPPPRPHASAGGADPLSEQLLLRDSPSPGKPSALVSEVTVPPPALPSSPDQGLYSQLLQEAQAAEDARPELREVVHAQVSEREKWANEQTGGGPRPPGPVRCSPGLLPPASLPPVGWAMMRAKEEADPQQA